MKFKKSYDANLIAPCGINCANCNKHLVNYNPCPGCNNNSENKTYNCLSCSIRRCARLKKNELCVNCDNYPCKMIKQLEKTYVKQYNTSIMDNGEKANTMGKQQFVDMDMKNFKCSCGGILDLQDHYCNECCKKSK